jgi:hypothetical protein
MWVEINDRRRWSYGEKVSRKNHRTIAAQVRITEDS